MTTAIATPKNVDGLRKLLESPRLRSRLQEVASKAIPVERLLRLTLHAASRQQKLFECSSESIVLSLLVCARLGLEPDGAHGIHLVPFANKHTGTLEVQPIPDYRGLLTLARRSGEVRAVEADVVYEGDFFKFRRGWPKRFLDHRPSLDRAPNATVRAAYAIAELEGGGVQFEVLTRSDLDKIRGASRSARGPWSDWFESMCRKSAIRRLCKLLPRAVEAEAAAALDDAEDGDPNVARVGEALGVADGVSTVLVEAEVEKPKGAARSLPAPAPETVPAKAPEPAQVAQPQRKESLAERRAKALAEFAPSGADEEVA